MNIAQALKAEISRIAKKEIKAAIVPIRKPTSRIKGDVADLKNRITSLEKDVKRLTLLAINLASTQPSPDVTTAEPEGRDRAWISGKGVKTLRRKLGLTQDELAKLTGVSKGCVVQWESKFGMLKLRDATRKALMAVREIGGKGEARKRLEEMVVKKVAKPVKAAKKTVKKAAVKKVGLKGAVKRAKKVVRGKR